MDKPGFKPGEVVYWFEPHPDRYEIKSGIVIDKLDSWEGYAVQHRYLTVYIHAKYMFATKAEAEHRAMVLRVDDLEYDIRNLEQEIAVQKLKLKEMRKEQKMLEEKLKSDERGGANESV